MRFHAFLPLSQSLCFKIVGGLEFVARRWCKGMHEMRVWVREKVCVCVGGGELMGNMFRRSENSWLCMKFEFAFFAGHSILIRVFRLLSLRCLWKDSASFSCLTLVQLYAFCCTFFVWDFLTGLSCGFGPLCDFLKRVHAFGCIIFLWDVLMRFHAFWPSPMRFPSEIVCFSSASFSYENSWWDFMLFGRYEISLWADMLLAAELKMRES